MNFRRGLLLIPAALLALPLSSTARPAPATRPTSRPAGRGPAAVPVEKNKPYVHEPSGFAFPATLGSFRRKSVYRVDEAGEDVTVAFNDPDLKVVATVSVYPHLGVALPKHFDAVKREMIRLHPKAQTTADGAWTLRQGDDAGVPGLRAIYEYIGPLGGVDQDLATEIYLLARGKYFVKYRLTYPAADGKAARGRCQRFLEVLELPKADKPGPGRGT